MSSLAVLYAIRDLWQERGFSPTVREIGQRTGLKSTSTVHAHIQQLIREGKLTSDPDSPRTIRVVETNDGVIPDHLVPLDIADKDHVVMMSIGGEDTNFVRVSKWRRSDDVFIMVLGPLTGGTVALSSADAIRFADQIRHLVLNYR